MISTDDVFKPDSKSKIALAATEKAKQISAETDKTPAEIFEAVLRNVERGYSAEEAVEVISE